MECARPGPSPPAYGESTCRPSSTSGHGSVRAFAAPQAWLPRRPFARSTNGARRAARSLACYRYACSTGAARLRDPPADCVEWLGCPCGGMNASARWCSSDVPPAELIAVRAEQSEMLPARDRTQLLRVCSEHGEPVYFKKACEQIFSGNISFDTLRASS